MSTTMALPAAPPVVPTEPSNTTAPALHRARPIAGAGRRIGDGGHAPTGRPDPPAEEPLEQGALSTDPDAAAFQLFRRAVGSHDQTAWAALVDQFGGQVRAWVHRHPCWPAVRHRGDDDHWVTMTFERFWSALRPERLDGFPTLAALLAYLKLCAHSALLDEMRALHAEHLHVSLPDGDEGDLDDEVDVGALALDRVAGRELWQAVAQHLAPDEQLVILLSFATGHTPREIARRHPDRFPSVAEVYRVKRNALDRLRRSPFLRAEQGERRQCYAGVRR